MIYYILKNKDYVTQEEENQLEWLCLRKGYIIPRFHDTEGDVILAKEDDKIIGWAFVFQDDIKDIPTFYVYVSKYYRRKGIGTKLFTIASENFGETYCSYHNKQATDFFNSIE